jgi:hypothetical protein
VYVEDVCEARRWSCRVVSPMFSTATAERTETGRVLLRSRMKVDRRIARRS